MGLKTQGEWNRNKNEAIVCVHHLSFRSQRSRRSALFGLLLLLLCCQFQFDQLFEMKTNLTFVFVSVYFIELHKLIFANK